MFGIDVTKRGGKGKKHVTHRSLTQGNTFETSNRSHGEESEEECVLTEDKFGLGRSWLGKFWGGGSVDLQLYRTPRQALGGTERHALALEAERQRCLYKQRSLGQSRVTRGEPGIPVSYGSCSHPLPTPGVTSHPRSCTNISSLRS